MNKLQKALKVQDDIKEGDAFNRELQVRSALSTHAEDSA